MKKLLIVTSLIFSTLAANAETLKPGAERDAEIAWAKETQRRMQGQNTGIKCVNDMGNVSFELKPNADKTAYELVRTIDKQSSLVVGGLDCVIAGISARCANRAEGEKLETVNVGSATFEKSSGKGEVRQLVTMQVKSVNIPNVVRYTFSNGNGSCEATY